MDEPIVHAMWIVKGEITPHTVCGATTGIATDGTIPITCMHCKQLASLRGVIL